MVEQTAIAGFELTALLAPIAEDNPAGEDLSREAPLLHREINTLLPTGVPTSPEARSQRKQDALDALLRIREALQQRSKDLGLATPMVRALLRVYGFNGLRLGLQLLRELHERYWPSLFPAPLTGIPPITADSTDEDLVNRELRALKMRRVLVGQCEYALRTEVKAVAICPALDSDAGDYTLYRWEVAHQPDAVVPLDHLQKAAARRPRSHYEELHSAISACIDECGRLTKTVAPLYGRPEVPSISQAFEPPSFAPLRESLRQCAAILAQLVAQAPQPAGESALAGATGDTGPQQKPGSAANGRFAELCQPRQVAVANREAALALLAHAARFLHQVEPLSPIPYFVAKAVNWGALPSIKDWLGSLRPAADVSVGSLLQELGLDRDPELAPPRGTSPLRGLLRWLEGDLPPDGVRSPVTLPELTNRQQALALIADAAGFLYEQEPLSPLPHLLRRVLRFAQADSPEAWLAELLDGEDPTLSHILKTLGLTNSVRSSEPPHGA